MFTMRFTYLIKVHRPNCSVVKYKSIVYLKIIPRIKVCTSIYWLHLRERQVEYAPMLI